MVDDFVLREIAELNIEMSSMVISYEEASELNHNLNIESECDAQQNKIRKLDENGKSKPTRRSLRKRIRPPDTTAGYRQDTTKMQKMDNDVSDVEKYYLNKKVKRLPSTLETIFEEPKQQNSQKLYVSTRKFKRTIQFDEDLAGASRLKLKKRQLKAKKLPSSKSFLNRKKVSMDCLLKKLSSLESDKE